MKIYTKTGDDGQTGLLGGNRVAKDHVRIEAYGEVDELNSFLGWCRALDPPPEVDDILKRVQHELFTAGAELARHESYSAGPTMTEQHVAALEADIDRLEEALPALTQFILPAGPPATAALHVARGACRRAERRVTTLARTPGTRVSPVLLRYFNRFSDLLFVMARFTNLRAGVADAPWRRDDA